MSRVGNSSDPRVQRTRQLLLEAFMALVQEKRTIHSISIQEIAMRATVSRATFSERADQDTEMPPCDQQVYGALRHRVPGSGPAHEVVIARTLLVRSLTEGRVAHVRRNGADQMYASPSFSFLLHSG